MTTGWRPFGLESVKRAQLFPVSISRL
jgi:hypothetical protein